MHVELDTRLGPLHLELAFDAAAPETLAIVGPSGAGKTSILRAIAGLLRPDNGRVALGDEVWLDTGRGVCVPPERRSVGFVFQDHALFPHLSARQNVAYASTPERAGELLERFGLAARAAARPAALSGGERQRVALARALAREPRVLLLDEPLSGLDVRARGHATRELSAVLRAASGPALLVTHDFGDAATLARRVAVLEAGRIVQLGTPAELAARPASAFVADLTGAVVLLGTARAGEHGLSVVDLEGGGTLTSVDTASGPVAATVHPWEIAVEPASASAAAPGSARNRLPVTVETVTPIGSRVRLGLTGGQPVAAEVTAAAVEALGLRPGVQVVASFKAAATRLVQR